MLSRSWPEGGRTDFMEARVNRSWLFALIVVLMALGSGCKTAGYYRQAARGLFRIVADRQPIDDSIEAPAV